MIYHRKNKKQKIWKWVGGGLIILIILLLWFFGGFFKNIIHGIGNPVLNTKDSTTNSLGNFLNYLASKQEQADQIHELSQENKRLKLELLSLEILQNENRELREILKLEQENQDFLFAEVLTRPPFSPYDTFIIDKNREAVSVGDKVFYENILIGEIIESYSENAVVQLNSTSENIVPVLVNNLIEAEAVGQGGYNFLITLPKSTEIKPGTPVLTLEGREIIGVVQDIKPSQANTFSDIIVSYPVNPNEIEIVKIKKND